jgi:serine/threonine protein kinase
VATKLVEAIAVNSISEKIRRKRQVVVKRIQSAYASDPEFVSLFIDEARISGLLHHPNVVEVHGFGEHQGNPYLVMEYVEGPSVSRVLRALRTTGRRMPPAVAAYIAREVCRALAYVHDLCDESGRPLAIVHRDVTPSNVLLTRGAGVKLLDFGVAKSRCSESMTRAGTVRGKPAYLAPEQIEEKPIDRRVDLFSLGVVLHEMLSLEHLFAGDSDLVTVRKVLEMEIPRPSSRAPILARTPLDAAAERDRRPVTRRPGDGARSSRSWWLRCVEETWRSSHRSRPTCARCSCGRSVWRGDSGRCRRGRASLAAAPARRQMITPGRAGNAAARAPPTPARAGRRSRWRGRLACTST